MSEHMPAYDFLTAWGTELQAAVCTHCQWRYLIPCGPRPPICPNCSRDRLLILEEKHLDPSASFAPELVLPPSLSVDALKETLRGFVASNPFPPKSLTLAGLSSRLSLVYLPLWLVDGTVSADWQAEAGFDYEVVSHQEFFNGDWNKWESREIREPRIRWENRVGRMLRSYQNVKTPALEDAGAIEKHIGAFDLSSARSYHPSCLQIPDIQQACIRLPDQSPKEVWSETTAAFQQNAAAECQQACVCNHLRQFHWKANFSQVNWTLMLLPVYATRYLDDNRQPQTVLVHGQSGKVHGLCKASMRRAGRSSLVILLISALFFLAGLLTELIHITAQMMPGISVYLLIPGIVGVLASIIPLIIAWDFNHRQMLERAEVK